MKVSLHPFERQNIDELQSWANDIEAHRFMSRFLPHGANRYPRSQDTLAWYVIQVDDRDVGAVWLEKEEAEDDVAVLGILIGKKDLLGRGIGEHAINLAIEQSRELLRCSSIQLNVREANRRAQRCFRKCGFREIGRGVKHGGGSNAIPFLTMELKVQMAPR